MADKLKVGVLFGGKSGEHEVSLASARSIMGAMDRNKYEVVPMGISPVGRWLLGGDPMKTLLRGAGTAVDPASEGRELVPGATGRSLPQLDVVFPVLHGPFGEDGTVQGLFELAGIPYVGCGVAASSLCMDKILTKDLFHTHGLPQTEYVAVKRNDWRAERESVLAAVEIALGYPMFVKPANLGSSIGISKVRNRPELAAGLDDAARYDRRMLVEAAVPNAREIECSVLGNDVPMASVPGEIIPSREFYDYSAKYLDGASELLIPAPITAQLARQISELAVKAFLAVDGAGLARVDFLLDGESGAVYVNEINTMPGFTQISMYPKLWEATGLPYGELIDRLIELAIERYDDKNRSATSYGAGAQLLES